VESVQAQIAARGAHVASTPAAAISEAQASVVNSAIQHSTSLEQAAGCDRAGNAVDGRVARIAADAKRHLVKGVAEARNADVMIDYIGRLKQQPFFGNAVLTRHEANNQDANESLRFEFEAEWLQAKQ